jgi:hypothetical protein
MFNMPVWHCYVTPVIAVAQCLNPEAVLLTGSASCPALLVLAREFQGFDTD